MARNYSATLKPLAVAFLSLGFIACADPESSTGNDSAEHPAPETSPLPDKSEATARDERGSEWAATTLRSCNVWLQRFRTETTAFARQAENFNRSPSKDSLNSLQSRWRSTMQYWGGASLCLSSPLPDSSSQRLNERLALTAAAPALPGYLDRLPSYPDSGLIMDETVDISLDSLIRQHQITDPAEVSLGLYALEIILFGTTPAGRDWSDFTVEGEASGFQPALRRAKLLLIQTEHLAVLAQEWVAYLKRGKERQKAGLLPDAMPALLNNFEQKAARAAAHLLSLSRDRPGLAQLTAHDRVYLLGLLNHLGDWWTLPASRSAVRRAGLSTERWDEAEAHLDMDGQDGLPSHQAMQTITGLLLHLRDAWAGAGQPVPTDNTDQRDRAERATE